MPRISREKSSSGIYHIMIRGINRQSIFADDEDNEKFLLILSDCKALCGFALYGYCLMGNHVHLLLKETNETIGQIVKRIASRYVLWFNRKYMRSGHLFQERYKSEAVNNDQYFITVLRYIHQNPKVAGLCDRIDAYKWSSFNEYTKKSRIIDSKLALEMIGEKEFIKFMNEINDDVYLEYNTTKRALTDKEVVELIEVKYGIKALALQNEQREKMEMICRNVLKIGGVSTRQLARVTGIPVNTIWRL